MSNRAVEDQFTIEDVAKRLHKDYSTVHRWIKKGKITPVIKLGRRSVLIPASSLNRFLDKHKVERKAHE